MILDIFKGCFISFITKITDTNNQAEPLVYTIFYYLLCLCILGIGSFSFYVIYFQV